MPFWMYVAMGYVAASGTWAYAWWGWPLHLAYAVGWLMMPVGLMVWFVNKVLKKKITVAGVEVSYD